MTRTMLYYHWNYLYKTRVRTEGRNKPKSSATFFIIQRYDTVFSVTSSPHPLLSHATKRGTHVKVTTLFLPTIATYIKRCYTTDLNISLLAVFF
ncbi:hypothetical protein DICVIV_02067 [Dictyocaulus viviparus]|uniref:Uncharacterized protein n=1 Tax=Dictyocaulus viviparus TaxID=29172 RepID=A0A0D8YB32_DICVI|nr:hypothetical protein DICVIV_02067 [Dictyocaulus viviparus]